MGRINLRVKLIFNCVRLSLQKRLIDRFLVFEGLYQSLVSEFEFIDAVFFGIHRFLRGVALRNSCLKFLIEISERTGDIGDSVGVKYFVHADGLQLISGFLLCGGEFGDFVDVAGVHFDALSDPDVVERPDIIGVGFLAGQNIRVSFGGGVVLRDSLCFFVDGVACRL